MAESLYSTNLWLPSEKESLTKKTSFFEPPCLNFPTEFPYECDSFGSNSDLNSPVESVVSSTDSSEGSSEDDEFFVGLAQKLAWTSLCETEESKSPCFNPNKTEKLVKTGSPQSTLSGIDAWFCPESRSSQLKSPSMAVLWAEKVAREAARLKMSSQTTPYQKNGSFIKGFVGAHCSVPVKSTNNVEYELFSNQSCARNLAYTAQVQQMRENLVLQALYASSFGRQAKVGWTAAQPHRKPEIQNREMNIVNVTRRSGVGPGGLYHSPRIQPPQSHPLPPISSAMRRVHPSAPAVKRVSSGTGVFLPRRHANTSDFRQKQGNPGIRFPEEMKTPIQAPIMDSVIHRRNNSFPPIPRGFRAEGAVSQELHQLPQEWTY